MIHTWVKWSPAEDALLSELWGKGKPRDLDARFPRHNHKAIMKRGVELIGPAYQTYIKWSKFMERDLTLLWPTMTAGKICGILNRKYGVSLNRNGINCKAQRLKLKKNWRYTVAERRYIADQAERFLKRLKRELPRRTFSALENEVNMAFRKFCKRERFRAIAARCVPAIQEAVS